MTEPISEGEYFHALLEGDRAEELREAILKNPQAILGMHRTSGIFELKPLLTAALEENSLKCAKTILDLLNDKDFAARLVPKTYQYFLQNNPLYACQEGDHHLPAHIEALSTEQILLLAENGCDLHVAKHGYDLLESLLERYRYSRWETPLPAQSFYAGSQSASSLEPTLETVLSLGFSPHEKSAGMKMNRKNFAHDLLDKWVAKDYAEETPALESRKLHFLARHGFDLRPAMNTAPYEAAVNTSIPSRHAYISACIREIGQRFQQLCRKAPFDFLAAAPSSPERKQAVRIACAGGTYPLLLGLASKKDEAALTEAVASLDPYWHKEYRHSIRTAEATLARSMPVEQSALKDWGNGR